MLLFIFHIIKKVCCKVVSQCPLCSAFHISLSPGPWLLDCFTLIKQMFRYSKCSAVEAQDQPGPLLTPSHTNGCSYYAYNCFISVELPCCSSLSPQK